MDAIRTLQSARARAVAALALAMVAVLATASGAGTPTRPAPPAPTVVPNPAAPGQIVTVSGSGCLDLDHSNGSVPGGHVVVTVAFTPPLALGVDAAETTGGWLTTFTVPPGTPDGAYAITAKCERVTGNDLGALQTLFFTYPPTAVTVSTPTPAPAPTPVVVPPVFTG